MLTTLFIAGVVRQIFFSGAKSRRVPGMDRVKRGAARIYAGIRGPKE